MWGALGSQTILTYGSQRYSLKASEIVMSIEGGGGGDVKSTSIVSAEHAEMRLQSHLSRCICYFLSMLKS